MSEFEPLKEGRHFAGSLLRSAHGDAPSAEARRLAAAGLGLMALGSATPLLAGAKASPAKAMSTGATKWLATGFVVAAVAGAGIAAVSRLAAPSAVAPQPTAPARARSGPAEVPPSRAPAHIEAPIPIEALPLAAGDPPLRAAPGATAARGAGSRDAHSNSLDEEIAWLDPARASLQAGDGLAALAALDRAKPHVRLLASEALLLRVRALLLVGQRAEAEHLARPVLIQQPNSPHAERLRKLLAEP